MSRPSELAEAGPPRPWPAERIEYWAIERLVPYADNAPFDERAARQERDPSGAAHGENSLCRQ